MTIQERIMTKRQDLEMLQQFRHLTAQLVENLDKVGDNLDNMKDGTASVAMILANWQNVINSVSLASMGLMRGGDMPEPLVRIRDKEPENEEE